MTHGCSPFAKTRRNLTPLDIVTAHTVMPGREDVATLLEQAMRGEGWEGGRMEERRRSLDAHMKRRQVQLDIRTDIGKLLDLNPKWWGPQNDLDYSSSESDDEDEEEESLYVRSSRLHDVPSAQSGVADTTGGLRFHARFLARPPASNL